MTKFLKHAPKLGEAPTGICECGCGQPVGKLSTYTNAPMRYWKGYPIPNLPGHRNKAPRSDKGIPQPHRMQPIPQNKIPSGICECGCGEQTEIADRTLTKWRWFKGHPKPFIKGHHAKHNHLSNRGPDHPAWKGGRWIHKDGYVYLYHPEHPAATIDGYVYEHRLIAEEILGRFLTEDEQVHHINHNRSDNYPENLMVLKKGEHAQLHGIEGFSRYYASLSPEQEHKQRSLAGKKGAKALHDSLPF